MAAADYPYSAGFSSQSGVCKYDDTKVTTCMVDSYTYAKSGDIAMMKKALSHQPIAIALNASQQSF